MAPPPGLEVYECDVTMDSMLSTAAQGAEHADLVGPALGVAAGDADAGQVGLLQRGVQHLDEVGGLGAGEAHGGVRGPVSRAVVPRRQQFFFSSAGRGVSGKSTARGGGTGEALTSARAR